MKERVILVDTQCPRCGPGSRGVCYSADVCCTGSTCVLNDALVSLPCRAETLRSQACQVPGKQCASGGRCAIRGYCCGAGKRPWAKGQRGITARPNDECWPNVVRWRLETVFSAGSSIPRLVLDVNAHFRETRRWCQAWHFCR